MKNFFLLKAICLFSILFHQRNIQAQVSGSYIFNALPVTNPINKPGYTLIWNDEFSGSVLDISSTNTNAKWKPDNTVLFYPQDMTKIAHTMRSENLTISNDNLNIITRKEIPSYKENWVWQAYPGNSASAIYPNENNNGNGYNFDVTSAQINSNKDFKYGFFELRGKLPLGTRLWPAFWMFGQTGNHATEIDCFEIFPTSNGSTYKIGANLHWTGANGHYYDYSNCVHGWESSQYTDNTYCKYDANHPDMAPITLAEDLRNSYNTYAVEWSPTEIKFYFNNQLYLTEGSVSASLINERMRVIVNTYLNYNGNSSWSEIFNTLEPSSTFSIDYVRVYKKNPTLTPSTSNCKNNTLSYYATTGIANDYYTWGFSPSNAISNLSVNTTSSGSTATFQILPAYQNTSIDLTVTATGTMSYEQSATTIKIPDLNSNFSIDIPQCSSNVVTLTVHSELLSAGGSQWDIMTSDASGNITNSTSLQTGWGNDFTFNTGLVRDGYYVIKHGTWKDNCINWSESKKFVSLKLSDFTAALPICNSNSISLSTTSLSSMSGNQWDIFNCDNAGNTSGSSLQTLWNPNVTFTNLTPNSYYKIKHGVWGSCGSFWTESVKVIYIPNFRLNADFSTTYTNNGTTATYNVSAKSNPYSFTNMWTVQTSDAYGTDNPNTQVGVTQWGSTVTFTGLSNTSYYIIKHGVYNGCASWDERRYLVHGSNLNPKRTTDVDNSKPHFIRSLDFTMTEEYQSEMINLINSHQEANVIIYPNPSSGIVHIISPDGLKSIEILDAIGALKMSIGEISEPILELDLKDFKRGVYVIKMNRDSKNEYRKIVIE